MTLATPHDKAHEHGHGEWRRGWPVVLGAAAMFATGPGLYQNLSSLFVPDLERTLGITRGAIATSAALGLLGALAAPAIGRQADRIGVRPVLLASLALVVCGHLVFALMAGPAWQFQLGIALLALSAPGLGSLVFGRLIARRFDQHRGAALGLALTISSVSTLLLPPLIGWVIEGYGWRPAYLLLAVLPVLIGLPPALIAIRSAGERSGAAAHAHGPAHAADDDEPRPSWRDGNFWRLAVAAMMINAGTVGMVTQLALIGRERGLSLASAGLLLSAFGLSQLLGRLAIGLLVDRFAANLMAALFALVSAGGFAVLVSGEGGFALALVAVFAAGLMGGAEHDLLPYFASRMFPRSHYSEVYGRLLMLSLFGSAVGLVGFARVYDLTASYSGPLVGAAVLLLLAAALFARLPAARHDAAPAGSSVAA